MDSDKKIEMIEKILNDEPIDTIIGHTTCNLQVANLTEAGRRMVGEMFAKGEPLNRLDGCTMVVKIEQHKAQVSVMKDGVVVTEFDPVNPDFNTSMFSFPGISIPLTLMGFSLMDW